jgi:hypothetical protein
MEPCCKSSGSHVEHAHGLITIQVVFKEDPYQMLMTRRLGEIVAVAETPEGKMVGTGASLGFTFS